MKIALSRNALQPSFTDAGLIELAISCGFAGVEITQVQQAGEEIETAIWVDDYRNLAATVESAKSSGARCVVTAGPSRTRGVSRSGEVLNLAEAFGPAIHVRGNSGPRVVLMNGDHSPALLWQVAEQLPEGALRIGWDVLGGLRAGHSPLTAVTTLNSRLEIVRLTDMAADGQTKCAFGDGALPLRETVEHLRGIGFDGWLLIDAPPVRSGDLREWFVAAREKAASWIAPKSNAAPRPAAKAAGVPVPTSAR